MVYCRGYLNFKKKCLPDFLEAINKFCYLFITTFPFALKPLYGMSLNVVQKLRAPDPQDEKEENCRKEKIRGKKTQLFLEAEKVICHLIVNLEN